jgi:acetylornithine deacetylase/succinyl-diaminopimelate desuccinylase-like protein
MLAGMSEDFRSAAESERAQMVADLTELVAIPSVSSLVSHRDDVSRSAHRVAELLQAAGCPDVQVITEGTSPAVIGRCPAPAGQPTVCFYAHHDVQPVGNESDWETQPYELTEQDGRLFGRGAADDKAGVAVHVAMQRLFNGRPPVGVTFMIEGEEEIGSPHMADFLKTYGEELQADAYVIADSGNWAVGEPGFTTTLRGVCDCVVEVATLGHAVHSGEFGGAAPDALTALCRLLATLHTDDGSVAVEGLKTSVDFDVDYPEARFRAESSLLDGVDVLGTGTLPERLWSGPSVTVIGIDAPSVEEASNTLHPTARAKVSLRVPPGMAATEALALLRRHLETHAPWGAKVTVTDGSTGDPAIISVDSPIAQTALEAYGESFGHPVRLLGQGGSIPLTNELHEHYPNATILVTAVADPDSRMHSPNESVNLNDMVSTVQAQAELLWRLRK